MKDTISFRPLNQDTLPGSRHQSHCLNPSTTKINQEETKNHEKKKQSPIKSHSIPFANAQRTHGQER